MSNSKLKILNLYCGIGGNRALWGDEHDITAVDNHSGVLKEYKRRYPGDTVINGDAREYLQDHYDYDFIWASPPCQSHSRIGKANRNAPPRYPDLGLYEIILFLKGFYRGGWVVENVIPWYEPLIPAQKLHRHLFWSNFHISLKGAELPPPLETSSYDDLAELYGPVEEKIFLTKNHPEQVYRNCVSPELGLDVLNSWLASKGFVEQTSLQASLL